MSKDIVAKIDSRQAEFETLSRATAALLEQHEKLRADFDIELDRRAKKSALDLERSLKSRVKELNALNSSMAKAESDLEAIQGELNSIIASQADQNKRSERERAVFLEIIAQLGTEKLTLEGDKALLLSEKQSLADDINRLHTGLTDVSDRIKVAKQEQSIVDLKLEESRIEFDFNSSQYAKEEQESKNRLSILNSQLNQASRSLHEVKAEEDTIRSDLADLSLQLDKREQTINSREAKVAQQEKRVFNYSKFTGL